MALFAWPLCEPCAELSPQDNFSLLLSELFHDGGVTQERVLVLFFFCSDLAVRALRAGLRGVLARLTRSNMQTRIGNIKPRNFLEILEILI